MLKNSKEHGGPKETGPPKEHNFLLNPSRRLALLLPPGGPQGALASGFQGSPACKPLGAPQKGLKGGPQGAPAGFFGGPQLGAP